MCCSKNYFASIAVILVTVLAGCSSDNDKPIEATAESQSASTEPGRRRVFDKLLGTWKSDDGKTFERWTKNENGSYHSDVFSVKGTDTSWNEQANIYRENDKWIFENTVKGQNEGKPVKFTSILFDENSVQFSNPAHDFPTDINYTVPDANTVKAFIVGPNKNGGKDTIPFGYTRFN